MPAAFEVESTLTDRYQATVPATGVVLFGSASATTSSILMPPCRQMMNEWWDACALVRSRITVFTHPLFIGKIEALEQQMTRPEYLRAAPLVAITSTGSGLSSSSSTGSSSDTTRQAKGLCSHGSTRRTPSAPSRAAMTPTAFSERCIANGQRPSDWEQLLAEARA